MYAAVCLQQVNTLNVNAEARLIGVTMHSNADSRYRQVCWATGSLVAPVKMYTVIQKGRLVQSGHAMHENEQSGLFFLIKQFIHSHNQHYHCNTHSNH